MKNLYVSIFNGTFSCVLKKKTHIFVLHWSIPERIIRLQWSQDKQSHKVKVFGRDNIWLFAQMQPGSSSLLADAEKTKLSLSVPPASTGQVSRERAHL